MIEIHLIKLKEGQTEAPQLLTEADLIALMEKHGIGKYISIVHYITLSKIQTKGINEH